MTLKHQADKTRAHTISEQCEADNERPSHGSCLIFLVNVQ